MKRYYIFDYIWYIGEALRKKDGNSSSGDLVLCIVWLFGVLVPLFMPVMYRLLGNPVTIMCGFTMIFLPDVFCKIRYKEHRRKAIMEHYSELKSLYLRLFVIYVVTILFAAIALSLMFSIGFITYKI